MPFTVISNSFKDGDYLASDFILSANFGFGCAGGNKSPHLAWSGAPAETKSFAVTCYDPDAPTGSGFWHWLVVNIQANVSELVEGAGNPGGKLPAGALQTRTDFGAPVRADSARSRGAARRVQSGARRWAYGRDGNRRTPGSGHDLVHRFDAGRHCRGNCRRVFGQACHSGTWRQGRQHHSG